jgi:hypothetical protein
MGKLLPSPVIAIGQLKRKITVFFTFKKQYPLKDGSQ